MMKRSVKSGLVLMALAFVLVLAVGSGDSALAQPSFGDNCATCHNDGRTKDNPTGAKAAVPAPAPAKAQPASDAAKPAAPAPATKAASSSKTVTLTNLKDTAQVTARTISGKDYLPVRKVVEFFGGQVAAWATTTKTATVVNNGKVFEVKSTMVGNTAYAPVAELGAIVGAAEDNGGLKRGKRDVVSGQWATTKHNIANLGEITAYSPSNRDSCIACHDGEAFQKNVKTRAELSNPEVPVGQTCDTCHGDRGKSIRTAGTATLPQITVEGAGKGALCMTCHNARKVPTPGKDKLNAPHGAAVSGMLLGVGGWEVPGVVYPSSPHGANPDTCVSCHMAEKDGVSSHTFAVESAEASCGSCHAGLTTVNRTALGDFDGDGTIKGIQDEVKGLVHRVENALNVSLGENSYHESHGGFVFEDKNGTAIQPTEVQYRAAWNIAVVEVEGSWGVHNPAYIVKLLQSSFKELMGYDVPGAALR